MRMKTILTGILLLSGLFVLPSPGFSGAPEPHSKDAKRIVALVEKAAALIESRGEKAFPEFRKKGSVWYKGGTYVFVDDMKGTSLVNPQSPHIEGTNVLDWKDPNGKFLVREMIEMFKTRESGWIDYMWPKPGETKPSKKWSYIKRVKMGKEMVLVGAGIYSD